MVAPKEAGYSVAVDGMIKVSTNRISAADAVRLRQLGYEFSLADLVALKSAGVLAKFMMDVYDPDCEPFTVDELIGFRRKDIDIETIRKIRTDAQPR
jgi:hypothetical protein